MIFNLQAAKAYVGGLMASAGIPVGTFFIQLAEKLTGWDIPASAETLFIGGVAYVLGHLAVYFTPNASL